MPGVYNFPHSAPTAHGRLPRGGDLRAVPLGPGADALDRHRAAGRRSGARAPPGEATHWTGRMLA